MASTPKEVNGNGPNGPLGKRKKSRGHKVSYLDKWLDAMHHVHEPPNVDAAYANLLNQNHNWQNHAQFTPGYDPYKLNMYGSAEPMSLPTLPTYYNPVGVYPEYRYIQSENKSVQVQRPRPRRRTDKAEEIHSTPLGTPNGTLKLNYLNPKTFSDSQDFASLPPIVTSVGDTTSNSDMNATEKNDNRRYSDPCVQGLPDVARPANGEAESDSESGSGLSENHVGSRLLSCLLDQITTLKMNNERLNKELQDTKAELTSVRQQNSIWQKGSNSSLGTPNHSPLNGNGLYNGSYSPGVLTDLVREIRDAARLREDAMYARLRNMLHERTENGLSTSDVKYSERSLDDIKSSLRASELDKRRMMQRINKLEDELRTLRLANGLDTTENSQSNGNSDESETERTRLRKELTDMRRAKQNAEEKSHKLEMLVTQLRSKFKTTSSPNGPDSLPSEPEPEPNARVRRTSTNSNSNSTVVFGPVTDL